MVIRPRHDPTYYVRSSIAHLGFAEPVGGLVYGIASQPVKSQIVIYSHISHIFDRSADI